MSKKAYDFPVVRYRNGTPATWFRSQVVFAEEHEKALKKIEALEKATRELLRPLANEFLRAKGAPEGSTFKVTFCANPRNADYTLEDLRKAHDLLDNS